LTNRIFDLALNKLFSSLSLQSGTDELSC